jgi:hypothetical protein
MDNLKNNTGSRMLNNMREGRAAKKGMNGE